MIATRSAPASDTAAIRQIVRALRDTGHTIVSVFDGEDRIRVRTESEAIEAISAVDAAHLHVNLPDGSTGWVLFVLGNSPEEVAADYTTNLSAVIDPLTGGWL